MTQLDRPRSATAFSSPEVPEFGIHQNAIVLEEPVPFHTLAFSVGRGNLCAITNWTAIVGMWPGVKDTKPAVVRGAGSAYVSSANHLSPGECRA